MKYLKQFFKYIEPAWCGDDGKFSLKRFLAIVFSFHALNNISYAVHRWDGTKSLSDLAMLVGIELGFVGALIGIAQFTSFLYRKTDLQKPGGTE